MTSRRRPALVAAGFFLLRVPALPGEVVDDLWCPAELAARLRRLATRPEIACALFLASPDLFRRAQHWLDAGGSLDDGGSPGPAILRYLLRMASRPTPHGLLAGTAIGALAAVGEGCRLSVPSPLTQPWNVRVDPQWPHEVAAALASEPALRPAVRYAQNPSLYRRGRRLRYCEPYRDDDGLHFRLSEVEDSPHLAACLQATAHAGGATLTEMAAALREACPAVDAAAATGFAEALVDAALVLAAGSPAVTGDPGPQQLADRLADHEATHRLAATLATIVRTLPAIDREPCARRLASLRDLDDRLRALPYAARSVRRLRADLHLADASPTLPQAVIDDIASHVEDFVRLAPPRGVTPLSCFATAFERRYRHQQIPLLEALDEESGIGFDGPGAATGGANNTTGQASRDIDDAARWRDRRRRCLLGRLVPALRNGDAEIRLSRDDMEALAGGPGEWSTPSRQGRSAPLPAGLDALVAIAAPSAAAVASGDYRFHLRRLLGPNCARLIAHLCQSNPRLEPLLVEALRREEAAQPDALHAEIVHLPHGHAANSICRPVLRAFEIPVFSPSGAPPHRQLALADLLVHVERGEVRLTSRRHRCRVMPHLSCAHAYGKSNLGLFRFLAAIEEQHGWSELGFSWGGLEASPFLPRLSHGRCILSLARWTLPAATLLHRLDGPPDRALTGIRTLRAETGLPRQVRLLEDDQSLPIDLEHPFGLRLARQAGRRNATVVFEEIYPTSAESPVRCGASRYFHELVVPYLRLSPAGPGQGATHTHGTQVPGTSPSNTPAPAAFPPATFPPATFPPATFSPGSVMPARIATAPFSSSAGPRSREARPGSDWLYVVAEAGPVAADRLLVEPVWPLMDRLRAEGAIDGCFFVRYADPAWQLRLRLHGEPTRLWRDVAPRLLAALADAGPDVTRVAVETYFPECARYGGEVALALAHAFFEADSDHAVAVARCCSGDTDLRGRVMVHGMHTLLQAFGLSLASRESLLLAAVDGLTSIERDAMGRDSLEPGPDPPVSIAFDATRPDATRPDSTRPDPAGWNAAGRPAPAHGRRIETRQDRSRRFQARRDLVEALLGSLGGLPVPIGIAALDASSATRSRRLETLAGGLRDLDERGRLERPLEAIAASCLHLWANRALRSRITVQERESCALLAQAYRGIRSRASA